MKRRIKSNNQYFRWGLTAFVVVAASILFYFGLDYLGDVFKVLGELLGILNPFVWGFVISYLLLPFMNIFESKLFSPLTKNLYESHPKMKRRKKLARGLSVFLSETLMILLISTLLYLVIPQLYDSIENIVIAAPDYLTKAYAKLDKLLANHPEMDKYAEAIFGNLNNTLIKWAQNTVLPNMDTIIADVTSGVYSVVMGIYNIVIGMIVSIYVLYNKESVRTHFKKLLYCVCKPKNAKRVNSVLKFTDQTFRNFITGQLTDALIVGILCFIGCSILKIPYALLISVVVGATNVIPFFGPFIGGIPSGLLVLMVDPFKCLIFVIFIVALQQVDGNIICPKIMGGSVGINGFWVMFAIILGGGLFGFWGMLLGVPVFVVIYTGVNTLIERKLRKRNLPDDDASYEDLDYIEPQTGELVKVPPTIVMAAEPKSEEPKTEDAQEDKK